MMATHRWELPSLTNSLHWRAFSRAMARLTVWMAPRPISRALPASVKRNTQLFDSVPEI